MEEQEACATQPDAVDVVPATPTDTQGVSATRLDGDVPSQQGPAQGMGELCLVQQPGEAVAVAAVVEAGAAGNADAMHTSGAPDAHNHHNTSPAAGGQVVQARGAEASVTVVDAEDLGGKQDVAQQDAGEQHERHTTGAGCIQNSSKQGSAQMASTTQPHILQHNSKVQAAEAVAKLVPQKRNSSTPPPSPHQPMKRQLMNAFLTESIRAALDDALEDVEALSISQ
jgi:hypothetical protein